MNRDEQHKNKKNSNKKNEKRHLSLEDHSSRYQMIAFSSSSCGFCGGIGGSIHGLWWNKALLRVV